MSAATIRTRITRTALLVAAAAGFAFSSHAAPADAAIGNPKAKLIISEANSISHRVTVYGHVPMTPTEAQGLIDSGHYVAVRLWGDDFASDDLVDIMARTRVSVSSRGLEFFNQKTVADGFLDEDWGTDELYSSLVLAENGNRVRATETNRWVQSF